MKEKQIVQNVGDGFVNVSRDDEQEKRIYKLILKTTKTCLNLMQQE